MTIGQLRVLYLRVMRESIFERAAQEYDRWYELNPYAYLSEIEAIRPHLKRGLSIEVGVGTGRFALPLGIDFGLDPSVSMLKIAKERGIKVIKGCVEKLPFKDNIFDNLLLVVTICFLEDPNPALKEANRVLKKGGRIILGFVDKKSFLGKLYLAKKEKSRFYRHAKFYSSKEIIDLLKEYGFKIELITQTLFKTIKEIHEVEPVKEGFGEGGFVVISAIKEKY